MDNYAEQIATSNNFHINSGDKTNETNESLACKQKNDTDPAVTTTISTIALQSGDTRLVMALLQSGVCLKLKVLELEPELTSLGENVDEATSLASAHDQVLIRLQSKQSPVEELLRQADHLISTQTPRAEIYAAMAESLGQTWKDVNSLLEIRKQILDQNLSFQCRTEEFQINAKALNVLCTDSQLPTNIDAIRDMINKINDLKTVMLNSLLRALNEGKILMEKLESVNNMETLESLPDKMQGNIEHAVNCVQQWLEAMHEQRKITEMFFHQRKVELEQCLALALIATDLRNMEIIVNDKIDAFNSSDNFLGYSEESVKILLLELRKFQEEASQLQKRLLKVTKTAERLSSANYFTTEEATRQAYSILEAITNYIENLENYESLLKRAMEFFASAEGVLIKFDQWQIDIESNSMDDYEDVKASVLEHTSDLLIEGYGILDAVDERERDVSRRGKGIVHTLQLLEDRKIYLLERCAVVEENYLMICREFEMWLKKYNESKNWLDDVLENFLRDHNTIGDTVSMAKCFNDNHCLFFDLFMKRQQLIHENIDKFSQFQITSDDEKLDDSKHDIMKQWSALREIYSKNYDIIQSRIDLSDFYINILDCADTLMNLLDEIGKASNVDNTINMMTDSEVEKLDKMLIQVQNLHAQLTAKCEIFVEKIYKNTDPHLNKYQILQAIKILLNNFATKRVTITESWENWKTLLISMRECEIQQKIALNQSTKIVERVEDWKQRLYPILSNIETTSPLILLNHIEDLKNKRLIEFNEVMTDLKLMLDKNGERFIPAYDECQQTANNYNHFLDIFIEICKYLIEIENKANEIERLAGDDLKAIVYSFDIDLEFFDTKIIKEKVQVIETMITTMEEILRKKGIGVDKANLLRTQQQQSLEVAINSDVRKVEQIGHYISQYAINICSQANLKIQNYLLFCNFVDSLISISTEINQSECELNEKIQSNWWLNENNDFVKRFATNDFKQFNNTVHVLDIKITELNNRSMTNIKLLTDPQMVVIINRELLKLKERWNKLDSSSKEMEKRMYKILEYFKLLEEAENWYAKLNELLKFIGKDLFNIKTLQESQKLLKQIEDYTEIGEGIQEERIRKLRSLSTHLFGTERLPQFNKVIVDNQASLDLYIITVSELRILIEKTKNIKRSAAVATHDEDDISKTTIKMPKLCKPVLIQTLENMTVDEDQVIMFTCSIQVQEEDKKCHVTWYKNDTPIFNSARYSIYTENRQLFNDEILTCTLKIEKTLPEDCGEYKCKASNMAGLVETSALLKVNKKLNVENDNETLPIFIKPLQPMTAKEGSCPTIECKVEGNPLPTVQWYRNQINIDHTPDYIITYNNGEAKLKFLEITPNDQGIYSCKASNKHGNAITSALIKLLDENTNINDSIMQEKNTNETVIKIEKCQTAEKSSITKTHQVMTTSPSGAAPSIKESLKDIEIHLGENTKLDCTVIGKPEPEVIWYHNNQLIKESADFQLLFEGDKCSLIIRDVVANDAGKYKIVAINERGSISSECTLSVISPLSEDLKSRESLIPPFFYKAFKNHYLVSNNESIKLECAVHGKPTPKITWLFNGKPIISGKDFRISVNDDCQKLEISQVPDAASISCLAENIAGSATCATQLETADKVTKETSAKKHSTLVPDEILTQSSNSCEKSIETEPHQIGQETIANMSSITQSSMKNSSIEEYKLTTKSSILESNDNKRMITNNMQNGKPSSLQSYKVEEFERIMQSSPNKIEQEKLKIISETTPKVQKQIRKNIPPRFISPLTGMIVDQDSNVVLEGAIDGFPQPTITWTKNGQDLKENIKTSIDHGHVRLELKNVNVKDAGRYTCTAVNELGNASSTADVVVKKTTFPPVFGKRLQAQVVKAGERVIMEVEITGTPEPKVTWYKDDEPLMDTDGELKQLGNCYLLIIEKVEKRHAGKYMVNASNPGGEAQSIADFAVFEPTPDTMIEVHKTMVYENIADKDLKLDEKKSQLPSAALTAEHIATTMIQPSSTLKTLIPISSSTSSSIRRIEMIQPQSDISKKQSIESSTLEKAIRSEMVSATVESHQSETKSEQKFHMKLQHETPDLIFDKKTLIGEAKGTDSTAGLASQIKTNLTKIDDVGIKNIEEDDDKRYDVKVDKITKNYERSSKFEETKEQQSSSDKFIQSSNSKTLETSNLPSGPAGIKSIDFSFDACKLPLLNTQRTILEDTTASGSPIHGTLTISKLAAQSESAEKMLSGFNLTPGPPPEIGYMPSKKPDESSKIRPNPSKTIQFEDQKKDTSATSYISAKDSQKKIDETCEKWWSSTSDLETRSHISTDLSEYRCPSEMSECPPSPKISADALAMEKTWAKKFDINRKSWPPSSNIAPLQSSTNDQAVGFSKESLSQEIPETVCKVASNEKRETIENIPGGGTTKTNIESSSSLETRSWSSKENRIEQINEKSATLPRDFSVKKPIFPERPQTSGQMYKAETIKVDHTSNRKEEQFTSKRYSSDYEVQKFQTDNKMSKFSELKAPQLVKAATTSKPGYVQLYHSGVTEDTSPRCDRIKEFQASSSIFKGTLATAPRHNSLTGSLHDPCMVLEPGPPPEIGYMPPPSNADDKEPKYRKVKAPIPKQPWPKQGGPEPLPPSSFTIPPPDFTGPPRPFVSNSNHLTTSDSVFQSSSSSVYKPTEMTLLSHKELKGPFKFAHGECKSDIGINYTSGISTFGKSTYTRTSSDSLRSITPKPSEGVEIIQPYLDILPKKAPLFTTPLRDIAVLKNQTARFECIVEAEPQPQITWSMNDQVLHNSTNYQLSYRNGVCRLVIPCAYVGDSGIYKCTAKNCLGSSATSATLHVKETARYG